MAATAEKKISTTFLRELLNAAAVKVEAVNYSGSEDTHAKGIMQATATAIAYIDFQYDVTTSAARLMEEATERAKVIFSSGQDWRRELELGKNLLRRFA